MLYKGVCLHPANRGMSLATREQKDVTTDFVLCRDLLVLFGHEKKMIEQQEE